MDDLPAGLERGNVARVAAAELVPRGGLWHGSRSRGARGGRRAGCASGPGRAGRGGLDEQAHRRPGGAQAGLWASCRCGSCFLGEEQRVVRSRRRSARLSASLSGRAVDALAQPHWNYGQRQGGAGVGRASYRSGWASSLRISADAFFQTNTEMAELLARGIVSDYASLEGWERVYDLYSGVGTIALAWRRAGRGAVGHRAGEPAVADAIAEAARSATASATLTSSPATPARRCPTARAGRSPDVLVVDPPRGRPSKKVGHRIIDASPKRIVYVSCNPTTLARTPSNLVDARHGFCARSPSTCFRRHTTSVVALLSEAQWARRNRLRRSGELYELPLTEIGGRDGKGLQGVSASWERCRPGRHHPSGRRSEQW